MSTHLPEAADPAAVTAGGPAIATEPGWRRDEHLRWFVDRLAGGWMQVDAELSVRALDSRWTAITGQSVNDAHGLGWIAALDPTARMDFLDALRGAFARAEGVHGQLRLRHRDGSLRWIEFAGAPPRAEGDDAFRDQPIMLAFFRDVTPEIEAHRRAEELTRVLEASTDFVMIVEPERHTVRWANDSATKLFDTSNVIGSSFIDLFDDESRGKLRTDAIVALSHAAAWHGELVVRPDDNRAEDSRGDLPVSALLVGHRAVDGSLEAISVVARDLSALREAEQRVEATEIKLAALVEHASDIMCVIRPNGRVRYASPAFLPVLGRGPHEIEGSPILELVHPDDAAIASDAVAAVLAAAGVVNSFDVRVQHADGSWRHLEVVATNLVDNTAVNGVVLNARDVTDRVRAAAHLRERAYHDELTGLPNRALLLERLRESLRRAAERERLVGVLFLDLDRFKIVNDSLGHVAGDELLREVARRIRDTVRPDDVVARLGGDEFVVIVNDMGQRSDASIAARRLREAISEPIRLGRDTTVITTSVGITVADGGEAPEDLLRDSDTALYRAKERGRDRAHMFDERLRDRVVRRLSVEQQLRRALEDDRFMLHYQPVVRLADDKFIGGEALLRLRNEDGTLVYPGQFIEVAEDAGLMPAIGAHVLAIVCNDIASWDAEQRRPVAIGVNVSARQLSDAGFAQLVRNELDRTSLPTSRIYLELTESSLVDSGPQSARTLSVLHDWGVGLALDDFGTGFSSMAYLKRFPIDLLKVDRSFTDGLGVDDNDTAIVKATIALAHSLGIRVVAEGVETDAQLKWLREYGCDNAQGYLLGRPVPAADFSARLAE